MEKFWVSKYFLGILKENCAIIYSPLSDGICSIKTNVYNKILQKRGCLVNKCIFEDLLSEDEVIKMFEFKIFIKEGDDEKILLKSLYNLEVFSSNVRISVVPTYNCNFACNYCYEGKTLNDDDIKRMNDEDVQKIEMFFEDYLIGKTKLYLDFYGGEPLLEIDRVCFLAKRVFEICEQNGVRYYSNVVTNGYLLNEKNVKKLKDNYITSIAITLAGNKEVHDSCRRTKTNLPTYETILSNIDNVFKQYEKISIFLNVSTETPNAYIELLEILEKKYGLNKFNFRITPVYMEENEELNSKIYDNYLFCLEKMVKLFPNKINNLPLKASIVCGAAYKNSFYICPQGELYKCNATIGVKNACIGKITENGKLKLKDEYLYWLGFDPFAQNNICNDCELLPYCYGGCILNKKDMTVKRNNIEKCDKSKMLRKFMANLSYEIDRIEKTKV